MFIVSLRTRKAHRFARGALGYDQLAQQAITETHDLGDRNSSSHWSALGCRETSAALTAMKRLLRNSANTSTPPMAKAPVPTKSFAPVAIVVTSMKSSNISVVFQRRQTALAKDATARTEAAVSQALVAAVADHQVAGAAVAEVGKTPCGPLIQSIGNSSVHNGLRRFGTKVPVK